MRLHYWKNNEYGSISVEQLYSNTIMMNIFIFNFYIRLLVTITSKDKKDAIQEKCVDTSLAKLFLWKVFSATVDRKGCELRMKGHSVCFSLDRSTSEHIYLSFQKSRANRYESDLVRAINKHTNGSIYAVPWIIRFKMYNES